MNKRIALPTYSTSYSNAGSISWQLAPSSGRSGPHAGCYCSAPRHGQTEGETPHKSAFVFVELRSMLRPTICLITAANQQVNATPGRQAVLGRDQTVDLGDGRCRWRKKKCNEKICFKDGNCAPGGKLLLRVICRIAPRILIDWLLWSLWSRGNARLLFMVGHNQKIAAVLVQL